ncbi:MAG TPA: TlyA family RNA methyltransferase [Rickettsiales bacterium]|nr:TlyA family RNA methyltransferase [Rickettsiales bacterium]
MAKLRLDILLVDRGLADTRAKAQALIAAGKVYSNEVKLDKAGHPVAEDIPLTVREAEHPWVSRGGMKLAKGLEYFNINPSGLICLDVGASTGGFTDVLLTHGAAKVYAVDVGHGQLDWKLRQDARVVVLEKTNARSLDHNLIPDTPALIVCDASFISLKTVLPASLTLAAKDAVLIALIKPQFEVGKGNVGKGGVVRDESLHKIVCEDIENWLTETMGWNVLGITESPIKGPKGNTEFLIAAAHSH